MEDILRTRDQIEQKIAELEIARSYIEQYAKEKAEASARYELEVALTLVRLQDGLVSKWKDLEIKKIGSNSMLAVARGMCHQFFLLKEEKTGKYNGLIARIDCIKAELNGYQSINRHLD